MLNDAIKKNKQIEKISSMKSGMDAKLPEFRSIGVFRLEPYSVRSGNIV